MGKGGGIRRVDLLPTTSSAPNVVAAAVVVVVTVVELVEAGRVRRGEYVGGREVGGGLWHKPAAKCDLYLISLRVFWVSLAVFVQASVIMCVRQVYVRSHTHTPTQIHPLFAHLHSYTHTHAGFICTR